MLVRIRPSLPHATRRVRALVLTSALCALTIGVLPAPAVAAGRYSVTIEGPAHSPLVAAPFVLSGTVSPAAIGATVTLQRDMGGQWKTVSTTQLDAHSAYSFTQHGSYVGGFAYHVVMPGQHHVHVGTSLVKRVFVTGDTILSKRIMRNGNSLVSAAGSYAMTMQRSGDLTICVARTGRVIWSMGTAGHRGAWAVLQGDGNLVVHARDGSVLKTTGTGGQTLGTYSLSIQENSNLVILNAAGANLWSSDTTSDTLGSTEALQPGQWLRSPSQRYKLWMQTDGDLVLYRVWNHTIAWQTDTRVAGSFLTMQDDGNLVLRGPARKPLWSSRTSGYPGAVAVLQDDGNVVVSQHGVAYWTSNGLGGLLGDDYPANLHKAPRDSLIDPWRFYNRECTSFVAWRMNSANHVDFNNFMGGGHFGNAGNWDDNARALGYPVNSVPARGAIAESDSQGHVAWVAEVGDGTVTIEDYNFSAPGEYGTRTVPTSTYVYIHINDL